MIMIDFANLDMMDQLIKLLFYQLSIYIYILYLYAS